MSETSAPDAQPPPPPEPPLPPPALRAEIESVAAELAAQAGAEIAATLTREITVEYKREARGDEAPTSPVSEVDHAVEAMLRERLAERFPDHGVVGEEVDGHPDGDQEFLWVVDPVDGTTNFINGFPLFAASIGVLHHGRPVAGAIWCSASHVLRSGVYHAREGGPLLFDGEPVPPGRPSTGVARRLSAAPGGSAGGTRHWDNRVTGSAAIECAFVAAGIFRSAIFRGPALWDVAAGVTLVRSAGLETWTRGRGGWTPLERFEVPARRQKDREPSLRDWRGPLLIGDAEAVALLREQTHGPGLWQRTRFRLRRMLR